MRTFFLLFAISGAVFAQDAVPGDILGRTLFIKAGKSADCSPATPCGTGFVIAYHGKLFLVTAKHVVSTLPSNNAILQVKKAGNWIDLPTEKTLFPKSPKVDIAVFDVNEKATQEYRTIVAKENEGPTMGQQIWFLGYPFGIGTHVTNAEAPFIKRGTMSAVDASDPDAIIIYIDGFNNEGFSGGPIIYWSFAAHDYRILGVVKGYKPESAHVLINGNSVDTSILVNSGILIGYGIEYAIQAIEGK